MKSLDTHDYTVADVDLCASAQLLLARPVLEKVSDKWTILILTVLCPEPQRFNEIMRRLDGITHKALSEALKRLERNGLVTRTLLSDCRPIGVEYAITPLGLSLRDPFHALCTWALDNRAAIERAGAEYDRRRVT